MAGVEPSADEAGLVARAQRDPAAFAPLYARYVGPIYRYCYQVADSREAAEDATSQTFTRALAALPRYREGSFRGWLFTIAHNVLSDQRRQRPTSDLDAAADAADPAPTPEQRALATEERQTLRALLDQLTTDQRRIVELRLAGLTGPEIAQVLGCRPQAVKSAQFRAYARLRRLLAQTGQETDADVRS